QWYTLIRSINDYFNGKQSQVQLYEDGLPINKKDWQCFLIPFDAEVQLEKITAKSTMKEVQKGIKEQITYYIFYQKLQEVWEQFNEEFQLINKKLEGWGLSSFLRPFEEKDISNFIQFQSADNRLLSPLTFKKLL